jgi:hypothetical protein
MVRSTLRGTTPYLRRFTRHEESLLKSQTFNDITIPRWHKETRPQFTNKMQQNAFDETIAAKGWAEIKVVWHAKNESRLCKRVCTSKAKYHYQHPSNSMQSLLNAKHCDRKPLCRLTRLCPRGRVKQSVRSTRTPLFVTFLSLRCVRNNDANFPRTPS